MLSKYIALVRGLSMLLVFAVWLIFPVFDHFWPLTFSLHPTSNVFMLTACLHPDVCPIQCSMIWSALHNFVEIIVNEITLFPTILKLPPASVYFCHVRKKKNETRPALKSNLSKSTYERWNHRRLLSFIRERWRLWDFALSVKLKKLITLSSKYTRMGSSEQSTSRTTRSLKTFSNLNTDKEKAFYLCQGKRWVIQAFIDLFGHVLKKHIKLPPKILKQIKPFRKLMKVMTSKKSNLQLKKRYLCNVLSRSVFFPLLDKYLIPLGLKFFKKLTSSGHSLTWC